MIVHPTQKVYAVLSKGYTEDKYSAIVKADKSIDMKKCRFSDKIEVLIDKERD